MHVYDGLGNRYRQSVDSVTTTYLLDSVSGLTQVLGEFSSGDDVYYLLGLDIIGQQHGTEWSYFGHDSLGSVRTLTDASGARTYQASYDPYGVPITQYGAGTTTLGFTGEQTDPTGLLYLRARYANLGTGTFLTRDPFEGYMHLVMSRNGYSYVHGNPVNLTDPSGEAVPLLALGAKAGKFAVSCAANPACVAKAVAAIAVLQQVYKDVLCAIDPNQAICDVPTPLEMTCNAILDVAFNIPLSDMRHLAPGLQSSPLIHGFPAWYSGTQGQAQTSDLVDAQVQPRERTEDESHRVLFGQKRIGEEFDYRGAFSGETIYTVAAKLRAGILNADQVPVQVFERAGILIAINNRSLAALSLAGLRPTNIIRRLPTPQEAGRLAESMSISAEFGVPGNFIQPPSEYVAVTPSQRDLTVLDVIRVAP